MSLNKGAVVIGNRPELCRELWSNFVQSGLVNTVAMFSTLEHFTLSLDSEEPNVALDLKLLFFLIESTEDLHIPIELKLNARLSRVPLIAFYTEGSEITEGDIHTLYERRVSSVVPLPMRFHDLGKLVLQLDRYWAVGQLPDCPISIPADAIYEPSKAS